MAFFSARSFAASVCDIFAAVSVEFMGGEFEVVLWELQAVNNDAKAITGNFFTTQLQYGHQPRYIMGSSIAGLGLYAFSHSRYLFALRSGVIDAD